MMAWLGEVEPGCSRRLCELTPRSGTLLPSSTLPSLHRESLGRPGMVRLDIQKGPRKGRTVRSWNPSICPLGVSEFSLSTWAYHGNPWNFPTIGETAGKPRLSIISSRHSLAYLLLKPQTILRGEKTCHQTLTGKGTSQR